MAIDEKVLSEPLLGAQAVVREQRARMKIGASRVIDWAALLDDVNDDRPTAETQRIARRIKAQVDAISSDRAARITGQRVAVSGDVEMRA